MKVELNKFWFLIGVFCFGLFCYAIFFEPVMAEQTSNQQWGFLMAVVAILSMNQFQISVLKNKVFKKKKKKGGDVSELDS